MYKNEKANTSDEFLKQYIVKIDTPLFTYKETECIIDQVNKYKDTIKDKRLAKIIFKKYIENKRIEEIAKEMNYHPYHLKRLLTEALIAFYPFAKGTPPKNNPSLL